MFIFQADIKDIILKLAQSYSEYDNAYDITLKDFWGKRINKYEKKLTNAIIKNGVKDEL